MASKLYPMVDRLCRIIGLGVERIRVERKIIRLEKTKHHEHTRSSRKVGRVLQNRTV